MPTSDDRAVQPSEDRGLFLVTVEVQVKVVAEGFQDAADQARQAMGGIRGGAHRHTVTSVQRR